MEIGEVLKALFEQYGPAALPYVMVGFMVWLVLNERKGKGAVPHEYQLLIEHYHEAVVDVTKTIERLAVLIEERTRRHSSDK